MISSYKMLYHILMIMQSSTWQSLITGYWLPSHKARLTSIPKEEEDVEKNFHSWQVLSRHNNIKWTWTDLGNQYCDLACDQKKMEEEYKNNNVFTSPKYLSSVSLYYWKIGKKKFHLNHLNSEGEQWKQQRRIFHFFFLSFECMCMWNVKHWTFFFFVFILLNMLMLNDDDNSNTYAFQSNSNVWVQGEAYVTH